MASEVLTDVDQRSVCGAKSISAPCVLGWLDKAQTLQRLKSSRAQTHQPDKRYLYTVLCHELTTKCGQRLQPCSATSRLKGGKQHELDVPGKVMRSLRLTDAGLTVPLDLESTALGSASQVVYAATLPNC